MQLKLTLNPEYTGPEVIEDYMRKVKSQKSLGRIISSYNKRYFKLILNKATLVYQPEKYDDIKYRTEIPLSSVTQIVVENPVNEDKAWKHSFVIHTKKKSYKIISESLATMEKFLFGFSNLLEYETKVPLFNWKNYKSNSPHKESQILSNSGFKEGSNVLSPKENRIFGETNTFQTKENYESEVPKEESQKFNIDPDLLVSFRPPINLESNRSKNYENTFGVLEKNTKDENKRQNYETIENPIEFTTTKPGLTKEDYFEKETNGNKNEGINFEQAENAKIGHVFIPLNISSKHSPNRKSAFQNNSNRHEENKTLQPQSPFYSRQNSEALSKENSREIRGSQIENSGRSQIKMEVAGDDKSNLFGNGDISQDKKDQFEFDDLPKKSQAMKSRNKINEDRNKLHIGNGVMVSLPRFEETYENQDLPISYINMMEEAKKCSMIVMQGRFGDFKKGLHTQSRSGQMYGISRNLVDDDDDWDREFGDDSVMKRMDNSANKDVPSNNFLEAKRTISDNLLTYENRSNRSRKNITNHKQSEMFASREDGYNEWEDL